MPRIQTVVKRSSCLMLICIGFSMYFLYNGKHRSLLTVHGQMQDPKLKQYIIVTTNKRKEQHNKFDAVDVYNLTAVSIDQAKCFPLHIKPSAKICVHSDKDDVYVSKGLRINGIWERSTVTLFQKALLNDQELGVIDIGANLGLYSLTAAAMGRKVIAVEPLGDNIGHFHKSVQRNAFQDKITLVTNAISNKRERVYFKTYPENKGGTSMWEGKQICNKDKLKCPFAESILMDDLIPIVKSRNITRAIMKMDIEGAEHLAMSNATAFFTTFDIPMIFMEIAVQRQYCGSQGPDSEDKRLTNKMLQFLPDLGFTKLHALLKEYPILDPKKCPEKWPRDVVWVKNNIPFPPS